MLRMIWAFVRTILIPAAVVWFVCSLGCVWYFKVFMILFVINSVINDYRIGYWGNKLKARINLGRW